MISAIIVAAGKGTRMGAGQDKLFLELNGCPVIVHAWKRFEQAPDIDEILLVVREGRQDDFCDLITQYGLNKPHRIILGGQERQDSVWNGLQALAPQTEIVAIHDGARPCTPPDLIAATIQVARDSGAAVAAQRVTDTIKESIDGQVIARHPDRARLWAVQTPQTFRVEVIRRALLEVRNKAILVTDDTAACEFIGQPVRLVESNRPNPKLTVPADVPYLEILVNSFKP